MITTEHVTTSAAVQVLTNATLFDSVTAFIDGVPHHVLTFKDAMCQVDDSACDDSPFGLPSHCFELWELAIYHNNTRVLEALDALSKTPRYASCRAAVLTNVIGFAALCVCDVERLEWLFTRFSAPHQRQVSAKQFDLLAFDNDSNLTAVQWLHAHGYAFPAHMMDNAARNGKLALVRFLHEHGTNGCSTHAMDDATQNGYLDVVQFLHTHRNEGCTDDAKSRALENGHLDVLRFLCEHRTEGCRDNSVTVAAERGHLACIEFAHAHDVGSFTVDTMSKAVVAGCLDVVQFLHANRTAGCSLNALLEAEKRGHDDVVTFLLHNRLVANVGAAIRRATRHGHVKLAARLARSKVFASGPTFEYGLQHIGVPAMPPPLRNDMAMRGGTTWRRRELVLLDRGVRPRPPLHNDWLEESRRLELGGSLVRDRGVRFC